MANSRKRINVVSLSFDDSVYHYHYDYKKAAHSKIDELNPFDAEPNTDPDRLLKENQLLIQAIADHAVQGGFQEVVAMIGCGRQDRETEKARMLKTNRGLCVMDLRALMHTVRDVANQPALKFRWDTYLLADTYGILANHDKSSELVRNEIGLELSEVAAASEMIAKIDSLVATAAAAATRANQFRSDAVNRHAYDAVRHHQDEMLRQEQEKQRLQGLRNKNLSRLREANARLAKLFMPAYGTRSLGDTFNDMDADNFAEYESEWNDPWYEDEQNYILYVDHVSKAHHRDSIANILLDLGDDRRAVRQEIWNFFSKNPELMPGNLVMPKVHLDLKNQDENFIPARWFTDESKLTLLYAQMHKLASENPEAEIVFDFYEGRQQVLDELLKFFKKNRDLVPGNIVLRMHQYAGNPPIASPSIQGRGAIDYNYHHNVRRMVERAGFDYYLQGYHAVAPLHATDTCASVGVLAGFSAHPQSLRLFKKERTLSNDIVFRRAPRAAYQLGAFDPKIYLGDLWEAIRQVPDNEKTGEFKQALDELYQSLEQELIVEVQKGVVPRKIRANTVLDIAESTRTFLVKLVGIQTQQEGISAINQFIMENQSKSLRRKVMKVLAVIAALAVGLVVAAAIGVVVGISQGALTPPIIAGIATGAGLAGIGAAVTTGYLLFKQDPKETALKRVLRSVENVAQGQVSIEQAEGGGASLSNNK